MPSQDSGRLSQAVRSLSQARKAQDKVPTPCDKRTAPKAPLDDLASRPQARARRPNTRRRNTRASRQASEARIRASACAFQADHRW